MVEKWNAGGKSGVWSDFILTAVPRILNRPHSIQPNIPVFHYAMGYLTAKTTTLAEL